LPPFHSTHLKNRSENGRNNPAKDYPHTLQPLLIPGQRNPMGTRRGHRHQRLKYNLKNFSRRGATTAKDLKVIFPLGKSPIVTLEPVASEPAQTYQIKPNTLTESHLILQFISENYTDGIWVPESEGDKRRDVFFSELAKCTLLEKVDFALGLRGYDDHAPFWNPAAG